MLPRLRPDVEEYLRGASPGSVQAFMVRRLAEAAELRKELMRTLDLLLDVQLEAEFAALLLGKSCLRFSAPGGDAPPQVAAPTGALARGFPAVRSTTALRSSSRKGREAPTGKRS